ncbi:hypothetical protein MAQ58_24065, partial [Enterobacter sp. DRP3]|nr:hypothetical protein [Enterobacter sp. DRP3]
MAAVPEARRLFADMSVRENLLIVIEIALAFFFLHAESGLFLIKYVSGFFESLLKFAAEGTTFVFGGMGEKGLAFIFLGVLCPIIFISALI